jgi:TatD DNase family protein
LVLEKLAEVRGWTLEQADQQTTDAFFNLFDRIPRPAE